MYTPLAGGAPNRGHCCEHPMDSVKLGREPHEEAQGFPDGSYDVAIAQVVPRDVGFAQKHKALEGRVPTHTLISESETSAAQYSASELTHRRPVGFIRGLTSAICVRPYPTTLATRPMRSQEHT